MRMRRRETVCHCVYHCLKMLRCSGHSAAAAGSDTSDTGEHVDDTTPALDAAAVVDDADDECELARLGMRECHQDSLSLGDQSSQCWRRGDQAQ